MRGAGSLLLRNLLIFQLLKARLRHFAVFVSCYVLAHVPAFLVRGALYALAARRRRPAELARAVRAGLESRGKPKLQSPGRPRHRRDRPTSRPHT